MKNKIFSLLGLFLVGGLVTSCDNDQDVSPIISVNKPTMTIDFPTAITVNEGDEIPYTITLSQPVGQEFKVYVVVDQQNSTADGLDSDIDAASVNTAFEKVITFPAFTTTLSGVITINEDELAEPNEILRVVFGETRTSAVNFVPVVSNITIKNVISDELVLDFHYDKTFTGTSGFSSTLCKLSGGSPASPYDVDFLLLDSSYGDTGNLTAQTASCTESMVIDSSIPLGLYHVISNLFADGGLSQIMASSAIGVEDFNIPITVDYLRAGSINKGTFTQETANWFTSATPVGDSQLVVDVIVSEVNGVRKFTIQSTDATTPVVVATGKLKNLKFISNRKK